MMPVTPYMGLSLPTPGTSVPDWAAILNTAFSLLDSHDHTAGHGIQVPSAGVNINADLTFNGWNLTQARTLRLQQQAAAPALAQDAGCLYLTTAGDLWWNNGAGQHVQITSGSALSAASLGGISGLGGTSANVAYSNSTKTFSFTQAANQSALLDAGPLIIHDTAASAFGITLQSPVGIAGAYALTLPAALPASTKFLQVSATGTVAASIDVANGITKANLAAVGQQTSSASGTYSASTSVFTDVTNLTVTLTTTGRPVVLFLSPSTVVGVNGFTGPGGGTGDQATFQLLRDAVVVGVWQTPVSNSNLLTPGPVIDVPSAGTHTFKLQAKTAIAVGSASVVNMVLTAYEL